MLTSMLNLRCRRIHGGEQLRSGVRRGIAAGPTAIPAQLSLRSPGRYYLRADLQEQSRQSTVGTVGRLPAPAVGTDAGAEDGHQSALWLGGFLAVGNAPDEHGLRAAAQHALAEDTAGPAGFN